MVLTLRTFTRAGLAAGIALAWLVLAGPASADTGGAATAKPPQSPGLVGSEACLTCHEAQGKGYGDSPHARALNPRSPAAAQGCETCHGPGQTHVAAGGDKTKIKTYRTMSPREISESCMSCHNRGQHVNWEGGVHDARNLSCITCHSVHEPKSEKTQLKKASQIETCATCHRTEASKVRRSAHMPVREGKMECSSCHNAHGSQNVRNLRTGFSINEACVSCHAEKRGPFLWEHAAVRETCTSCHDPHGSSNERMLVAKQPMLCQRCHNHTRHPPTIYDATGVTVPTAFSNRLYNRSCVNCHSNIHGSNHPSGAAFLR